MKIVALALLAFLMATFIIPYSFRFDPSKTYLVVCVIGSISIFPKAHSYLVAHWRKNQTAYVTAKLAPHNVLFQAIGFCIGVFILTCFTFGMTFTNLVGDSAVHSGTVIRANSSRRCSRKLVISLDRGGYARVCTRTPYGEGSAIAVRVRSSALGQYVE